MYRLCYVCIYVCMSWLGSTDFLCQQTLTCLFIFVHRKRAVSGLFRTILVLLLVGGVFKSRGTLRERALTFCGMMRLLKSCRAPAFTGIVSRGNTLFLQGWEWNRRVVLLHAKGIIIVLSACLHVYCTGRGQDDVE